MRHSAWLGLYTSILTMPLATWLPYLTGVSHLPSSKQSSRSLLSTIPRQLPLSDQSYPKTYLKTKRNRAFHPKLVWGACTVRQTVLRINFEENIPTSSLMPMHNCEYID